jgi:hypothetical protein
MDEDVIIHIIMKQYNIMTPFSAYTILEQPAACKELHKRKHLNYILYSTFFITSVSGQKERTGHETA